MMTVSMMLILIPFTSEFDALIRDNPWINIFPGLTFFVVGLIGGALTDDEYKKAILMVAASYLIIGLVTVLNVSIGCSGAKCYYINYTLLGIPIGILLTTIGMILGFQLKEKKVNKEEGIETYTSQ